MRQWVRWCIRVISVLSGIIGLGGVFDDLDQWHSWLSFINSNVGRWIFVISGVVLFATTTEWFSKNIWNRRRKPQPLDGPQVILKYEMEPLSDDIQKRLPMLVSNLSDVPAVGVKIQDVTINGVEVSFSTISVLMKGQNKETAITIENY